MEDFLLEKYSLDNKFLNALECLNLLSIDEKILLENHKIVLEYNANEIIIKKGVLANNVMLLTEGLVKLEIMNDNRLSTVDLINSNSFIGLLSSLAFKRYDFMVTAIENSKVSFFDLDVFIGIIKNNGTFSFALMQHISVVTNQLLHKITRLSKKNIEGALSIVLLDFVTIYKSTLFTLPMKRKVLAEMLGYSKESIINTLSKFNKEGIISIDKKRIEILDIEKLVIISKFG